MVIGGSRAASILSKSLCTLEGWWIKHEARDHGFNGIVTSFVLSKYTEVVDIIWDGILIVFYEI